MEIDLASKRSCPDELISMFFLIVLVRRSRFADSAVTRRVMARHRSRLNLISSFQWPITTATRTPRTPIQSQYREMGLYRSGAWGVEPQ
jgi:hypothetical protein